MGRASNRREESLTPHTHAQHTSRSGPQRPRSHLLWPDSVSCLHGRGEEGGHSHRHEHLCSPQSASNCLGHTHWISSGNKREDYFNQTRLKRVFTLIFYLSVSASSFHLSSANEKIDDINGCPKSRSQMVSDLPCLFWRTAVKCTSVCVFVK